MATAWKGSISFGLVYIPVALEVATRENSISFNQLHKECGSRVNYKKVCQVCNQELRQDDIIRGYNYAGDKYVTISDAEIARVKTPRDKSIQIDYFVKADDIDPIYYERSYYVTPTGGEKQFKLLLEALKKEQKIGIAKTVLGTKDTIVALRAKGDLLVISTLYFPDEIRNEPHLSLPGELKEAEVSLACTLIDNMSATFAPAEYHDDYRSRLEKAIQDKIQGQEIIEQPPEFQATKVIDLMEALRQSVQLSEQQKGGRPQPRARSSASAKKTGDKPPKVAPELTVKRRADHTRQQPHS